MDGRSAPDLAFTHTRVLVTDYRECFRFYRDTLGLEVEWGDEEGGYVDFQTGETTFALFDRTAMAEAIGGDERSVAGEQQDEVAVIFEVGSVDDAYEQLRSEAEFITEPHDRPGWGIRVAHLRDPAGTLLEINEPLDDIEE